MKNYYKEWIEIISQLKKYQSIVVWVPFNEAWGQFDTKTVADFTKNMDPTRLVNAASGGNWIKGAGEILDTPVPTGGGHCNSRCKAYPAKPSYRGGRRHNTNAPVPP